MRESPKAFIQYGLARILLSVFAAMPRRVGYRAGNIAARLAYILARRQREVGLHNLRMALPELSDTERRQVVLGVFENLGRLLVEVSHFPELTTSNISNLVEYEGVEHYLEAETRGRGTIFLTLHMGAWELSPLAHALNGHPLRFLTRPIDNPRVDALVTRYRTLGGNRIIRRSGAMREILRALGNNEAVGFLIDQNTAGVESVFAEFFGIPASTTTGVAKIALRTRASVLPAFMRWDHERRRHILHFGPLIPLIDTGEPEADVAANTRCYNRVLEGFVRRAPEQWLWIHKRWKTRPEGAPSLY
jgi:KDO2-lipid IV(A) lauroyltransferase